MKISGLLLVFTLLVSESAGVYISRRLFNAIRQVETGGERDPLNAVGDGGTSRGPYQISEAYYNDAIQYDPSLRDGGKSYANVMGPGSMEYSERVIQAYMNCYATEDRLGRTATDEDIARIHNGGPNGYRKDSALGYWRKVEKILQKTSCCCC